MSTGGRVRVTNQASRIAKRGDSLSKINNNKKMSTRRRSQDDQTFQEMLHGNEGEDGEENWGTLPLPDWLGRDHCAEIACIGIMASLSALLPVCCHLHQKR